MKTIRTWLKYAIYFMVNKLTVSHKFYEFPCSFKCAEISARCGLILVSEVSLRLKNLCSNLHVYICTSYVRLVFHRFPHSIMCLLVFKIFTQVTHETTLQLEPIAINGTYHWLGMSFRDVWKTYSRNHPWQKSEFAMFCIGFCARFAHVFWTRCSNSPLNFSCEFHIFRQKVRWLWIVYPIKFRSIQSIHEPFSLLGAWVAASATWNVMFNIAK